MTTTTTDTAEEDAFHAMLDLNPDDHTTRKVFADWLEERGDPRAEGYRALGALGWVPYLVGVPLQWTTGTYNVPDSPDRSMLPYRWAEVASVGKSRSPGFPTDSHRHDNFWFGVATRRELEDAVALAFGTLTPDEKAEILRGAECAH